MKRNRCPLFDLLKFKLPPPYFHQYGILRCEIALTNAFFRILRSLLLSFSLIMLALLRSGGKANRAFPIYRILSAFRLPAAANATVISHLVLPPNTEMFDISVISSNFIIIVDDLFVCCCSITRCCRQLYAASCK